MTMSAATQHIQPLAILLHAAAARLDGIEAALDSERVERRANINSLSQISEAPDAPAVLLLDDTLAASTPDLPESLRRLPPTIVVVAADAATARKARHSERVLLTLPARGSAEATLSAFRAAFQHAAARLAAARMEQELARTREELSELTRIGMALMTERDPDRLLVQILDQARRLTSSDAGSLYLVETGEDEARRLRFKLSQTDSLPDLPFVEFTLPLDPTSVAGYAAYTGEPLNLEDAYAIPADAPYSLNRSFDQRFGYRTKSMLVVPMLDHRDEVVGVLQLINRKSDPKARITSEDAADEYVLPYRDHELQLVRSLAGQAAVSIENSQLYREIQQIFESFVKAAVTAIDQRDPTTAGHSVRVATLTCDMAGSLVRFTRGPYAGLDFSREQMRELRYAALLHDFGKVGVREEVLIKAKKLPPHLWERVESRFDLIRRTIDVEYHRRRAELLEQGGKRAYAQIASNLDAEYRAQLAELDRLQAAIHAANLPSVLPEKSAEILDDVARRTFHGVNGELLPFLTEDELHYLTIPKGSLDERERKEIESHVEQTYRFLTQIPWTDDLRGVADIAYGHHEKLNGTGYPRGVTAETIPVQTRIMTIADIFDALTASDRPYKKALDVNRALDILVAESKQGLLDPTLVELLIESGLYRNVLERDWREL